MVLNEFIQHVPHTIVGEPAGGPLNSYGDATSRSYPGTGLKLQVSTLWHQLGASDDLSEIIPVDVPAPFSFADYAAGRDPAVDAILRGDEMRSIPMIAAAEGGAPARKVYLDRKTRLGQFDWWEASREIDLRFVCQAFREQHRMVDALETCRLNVELHPYNWHAWFNLGMTQRAADQQPAGLASYRCVLAIDPNNFNADAIRDRLAKTDPHDTVAIAQSCPVH
jgi:hypothetical protein